MFTETRAMFLYCTSPVHMGAGTAVGGLIDNPIQRERHTDHPLLAGSGLKGAVRHAFAATVNGDGLVERIFGPDSGRDARAFAGAVSFTDAQIVAFPVRSPRRAFVYATCPSALGRARRLLAQVGVDPSWRAEPPIETGTCRVADEAVLRDGALDLEAFRMEALPREGSANLRALARWLADNALPGDEAYRFFRDKLATDLVLLADEDFGYFASNATSVEPHVRIDDTSGTADDGGLFYTENLPPESLLLGAVMASHERTPEGKRPGAALEARAVLDIVARGTGDATGIDGKVLQVGGDATTGRGLVVVRLLGGAER